MIILQSRTIFTGSYYYLSVLADNDRIPAGTWYGTAVCTFTKTARLLSLVVLHRGFKRCRSSVQLCTHTLLGTAVLKYDTYCSRFGRRVHYSVRGVFAQEVDGGGTEGMLLRRTSKRLLSNHLELQICWIYNFFKQKNV